MAYLLRSKGRVLHMRDGVGPEAPVYVVTPEKWIPFEHLPSNTSSHGDGDVEVKEVVSLDGVDKPEPFKKPEPKPAKPRRKAAAGDGAEAKPAKPRPRVR